MKKTLSIVLCLFINYIYAQSPGDLDSAFGINGKVMTVFGNGSICYSNLIQNDGKMLAAGVVSQTATGNDFSVVRYNTDGSLDTTFGTTGIVTTDIALSNEYANSMVLQTDGKILLCGIVSGSGNSNLALIRYEPDGSLDSTFGTGGIVIILEPGGFISYNINAIALQNDGNIIIGGSHGFGLNSDIILFRLKSNGVCDTTFDHDGIVTLQIVPDLNVAASVIVQPDGKIVVAGYTLNDIAVVRYNPNGALDTTFGAGGIVITPNGLARSVFLQPDDKIVVTGHTAGFNMCIVRYNSDGSLDTGFGNSGISTTFFGSASSDACKSIIMSNGKIVTAGTYHFPGSDRDFLLSCHNSNGFLDSTFGINGFVTTDFNGYHDGPGSLVSQQDGKIVLSGYYSNSSNSYFASARYLPVNTTGIQNIRNKNSPLLIFPNPCHHLIKLNVNYGATVVILNLFGEIVLQLPYSNINRENVELDVSLLSSGIYFINVGNKVGKFVKE